MNERIIWDGWCSIELPERWVCQEDDGVITLFAEDGVGALQISFANRIKGEPVDTREALDLARSFASTRGWSDPKIEPISLAGGSAARFDYVEIKESETTYWCVWHLVEYNRTAFITYICDATARGKEMSTREAIVQSFKWV